MKAIFDLARYANNKIHRLLLLLTCLVFIIAKAIGVLFKKNLKSASPTTCMKCYALQVIEAFILTLYFIPTTMILMFRSISYCRELMWVSIALPQYVRAVS